MIRVSLAPPPWEELTTRLPPGATLVRARSARGQSSWPMPEGRRTPAGPHAVVQADPAPEWDARGQSDDLLGDPPRTGSWRLATRRLATSAADASGPMSTPMPPCPSTGLVTSSPTRSSTVRPRPRRWYGMSAPTPDRTFIEVVPDQLGHVAVHGLVVGDPIPGELASVTGPVSAISTNRADAPSSVVTQIDQLPVQPQVEAPIRSPVDARDVITSSTVRSSAVTRSSPPARPAAGARTRPGARPARQQAPPCPAWPWASKHSA